MVLATDSAEAFSRRRVWVGLTLLTCLVAPGCARLRSFRGHDEHPAFGTDPAATTRVALSARPRESSGAVLARRSSATTSGGEDGAAVPDPDNRPLIALQP